MIRVFLVAALVATACAAVFIPESTRITAGLQGERWYRIEQQDRAIGYLSSVTRLDWRGRWHFESDLRIALSRDNDMRTREHLRFALLPPHALVDAHQTTYRNGRLVDATRLVRETDGYRWYSRGADGSEQRGHRFDDTFSLDDHLALERWLKAETRDTGARTEILALDLGERARRARPATVIANEDGHVTVDSGAGSLIELDEQLRPVRMKLAGVYDLRAVAREQALAPLKALHLPSQRVLLDRALTNPAALRALTLGVAGSMPASTLWPNLVDETEHQITIRRSTRAAPSDAQTLRLATRDHPADHPALQRLAQRVVADTRDEIGQIEALTRFVHGFVSYDETHAASSVLELLASPRGDCTEYADLLTTLARSLGLPARTVFGLAYQADPMPAFRFHAWNEVEAEGRWFVVDPTWNQVATDATHLPMPEDHTLAIALLTGEQTIRFTVIEEQY
jgi:transglutaminase-like putative cysteine protease